MTTKELLNKSIENLKNGENLDAQKNIENAFNADVDDSFEDLCLSLYNNLLIDDEVIAKKFKTLYFKQLPNDDTNEKSNIIINNNNNNNNNNVQYTDPNRKVCKKSKSLLLCALGFIGLAGFHKFYEGKAGMGILYLFTGGLFFIGTVLDFISLLGKNDTYYV